MSAARQTSQTSFDFSTPGDHAERVHTGVRHGTVLFWERAESGDRWIKCRPDENLPGIANALRLCNDAYFSVNDFNGWRMVRLLKSLRAVYIDLDGQLDIDLVLSTLASARMPAPSFVVWSGRGLHLYWSIQSTPAKALPVWQRVQDTLMKALAGVGTDPACRDCTRVLRLAGTINRKNGFETRGLVLTGTTWDLHSLANEVLGYREPGQARPRAAKVSAEVHDLNAAAARTAKVGRRGVLAGSIYGWWHTVYSDLNTIAHSQFHNEIPEGSRDKFLFLNAVALSWFAQPDAIAAEILKTGRRITSLTDSEIMETMAPVVQRRNDADNGKKIEWNGQERDPRYFFKASTLRDWIGHRLLEKHADQLRALAPAAVIKERKAKRDKARWSDSYTGTGVKASNEEKAAKARLMRASGCTQAEIASEVGVSTMTLSRWFSKGL